MQELVDCRDRLQPREPTGQVDRRPKRSGDATPGNLDYLGRLQEDGGVPTNTSPLDDRLSDLHQNLEIRLGRHLSDRASVDAMEPGGSSTADRRAMWNDERKRTRPQLSRVRYPSSDVDALEHPTHDPLLD